MFQKMVSDDGSDNVTWRPPCSRVAHKYGCRRRSVHPGFDLHGKVKKCVIKPQVTSSLSLPEFLKQAWGRP